MKENNVKKRKWLPTFADLIDRMSINQLKEVLIPKHKKYYSTQMNDMEHDLNLLIEENDIKLTGELIRAIIILAQINEHIWYNEAKARKGEEQDLNLLKLSHGLNGIRNSVMNYIKRLSNDKKYLDFKIDCLAAEFKGWEISLLTTIPNEKKETQTTDR